MLFEKNSTRTRLSFEVGINQLGGQPIIVDGRTSQLGREETIEDTSRVLSRYVDAVAIRTFAQRRINALASVSWVPVINALTDEFHPCQVLVRPADHPGTQGPAGRPDPDLPGRRGQQHVAFADARRRECRYARAGLGADRASIPIRTSCWTRRIGPSDTDGSIELISDPQAAVEGVDVVVTDTWTSMGQENDGLDRIGPFRPYQINRELLQRPTRRRSCCTACRPTGVGRSPTR